MRRIRRTSPEVRLDMTPLLDVIFLLLTFFVFSLVLMVRAEVLGVSLPGLGAAEEARGGAAITLTLDAQGRCYVDGEEAGIDEIVTQVKQRREANPGAALLIAADTEGRSGVLLEVVDRLSAAGIRDFALVGRPGGAEQKAAPNEGGGGEEPGSAGEGGGVAPP